MVDEPVIVVDNLFKRYRRKVALDGVSCTIAAGSAVAIVGPNGAGKTTLISIIAGLVHASRGSVRIRGIDISRASASRLSIGFSTDRIGAYPDLSARRNLMLECTVRELPRDACERVIVLTGMSAYAHRSVRSFSTGMRQRLNIAHALLADPGIVVLDEPLNGLDPDGISDMRAIIHDLRAAGKTVILCTHILSEADATCSHVLMLTEGKVRYAGPLRDDSSGIEVEMRVPEALAVVEMLQGMSYVSNPLVERGGMVVCGLERDAQARLLQELVARSFYPSHFSVRASTLESLYHSVSAADAVVDR